MSGGNGDGVLAWTTLRETRECRDAWDGHAAAVPPHALETGPFRIRVRSGADIGAARFVGSR